MTKIVINRPRDPLSGMIASYRSAYARKWRVPVSEVEEPAERAPETTSGEADAIHANPEAFDRLIRNLLFWKKVQ